MTAVFGAKMHSGVREMWLLFQAYSIKIIALLFTYFTPGKAKSDSPPTSILDDKVMPLAVHILVNVVIRFSYISYNN